MAVTEPYHLPRKVHDAWLVVTRGGPSASVPLWQATEQIMGSAFAHRTPAHGPEEQ